MSAGIDTLDAALDAQRYADAHVARLVDYLDAPNVAKLDREKMVVLALQRAYIAGALRGIEIAREADAQARAMMTPP